MNWVELSAGQYSIRKANKTSSCQLEVDVKWDKFISHPPESKWSSMAPLRILSFDIECAGRKGTFPDAQIDPVIQIANMVTRQGASLNHRAELSNSILMLSCSGEPKPFIRNVFTLNTCASIVGSQVISHRSESNMLDAWSKFVQEVDPDVIIGYNISNFDFPYLVDRAAALKVKEFPFLGRLSG